MTVRELLDVLLAYPLDDEVKLGFGDITLPIEGVYHEAAHDQDYVVIT